MFRIWPPDFRMKRYSTIWRKPIDGYILCSGKRKNIIPINRLSSCFSNIIWTVSRIPLTGLKSPKKTERRKKQRNKKRAGVRRNSGPYYLLYRSIQIVFVYIAILAVFRRVYIPVGGIACGLIVYNIAGIELSDLVARIKRHSGTECQIA